MADDPKIDPAPTPAPKRVGSQWLGRPVVRDQDAAELEREAALNEFGSKMPRAQAEEAAHASYQKRLRLEASAHHLAGMRAAHAAGDMEAARKHSMMYELHSKALGNDHVGPAAPEVQALMERQPAKIYKFKPHHGDLFAIEDHGKARDFDAKPLNVGGEDPSGKANAEAKQQPLGKALEGAGTLTKTSRVARYAAEKAGQRVHSPSGDADFNHPATMLEHDIRLKAAGDPDSDDPGGRLLYGENAAALGRIPDYQSGDEIGGYGSPSYFARLKNIPPRPKHATLGAQCSACQGVGSFYGRYSGRAVRCDTCKGTGVGVPKAKPGDFAQDMPEALRGNRFAGLDLSDPPGFEAPAAPAAPATNNRFANLEIDKALRSVYDAFAPLVKGDVVQFPGNPKPAVDQGRAAPITDLGTPHQIRYDHHLQPGWKEKGWGIHVETAPEKGAVRYHKPIARLTRKGVNVAQAWALPNDDFHVDTGRYRLPEHVRSSLANALGEHYQNHPTHEFGKAEPKAKSKVVPCRCDAYHHPHRAGGGKCGAK